MAGHPPTGGDRDPMRPIERSERDRPSSPRESASTAQPEIADSSMPHAPRSGRAAHSRAHLREVRAVAVRQHGQAHRELRRQLEEHVPPRSRPRVRQLGELHPPTYQPGRPSCHGRVGLGFESLRRVRSCGQMRVVNGPGLPEVVEFQQRRSVHQQLVRAGDQRGPSDVAGAAHGSRAARCRADLGVATPRASGRGTLSLAAPAGRRLARRACVDLHDEAGSGKVGGHWTRSTSRRSALLFRPGLITRAATTHRAGEKV